MNEPAVPRTVGVPADRVRRWVVNFERRHGPATAEATEGDLVLCASDGSTARMRLPFGRSHQGPAEVDAFLAADLWPVHWGILLVRKGGFAVASVTRDRISAAKVGRRHVQGRTKAGGQSQQRFARRRENQARVANEAAAGHACRILDGAPRLAALVCGGDRAAVAAVLADPRLAGLDPLRVQPWLPAPDPTRAVLEQAVRDAGAVRVEVTNR